MLTVEERAERIAEVVAGYLRAVVTGSSADDEVWAQQYPELLPDLAEALRKASLFRAAYEHARTPAGDNPKVDDAQSSRRDDLDSSLRIRCPHCHVLQEVAGDDAASTLACAACGSRFSLVEDETATNDLRGPRRVAHFTLLARLGSGGFGTVWKARDEQLDRLVAVKLPRRGQLSAAEAELFLREARAAAQLHHPGIVSIYEVGREGDSIYIVSELVEGVSLAEWLVNQRMSARESAEMCVKIAEALEHAHHHGVIHRDLKPANVLLDVDGQPHITDFGLARREAGEVTMTCDGQLLGTPAYMSPEQARGDSHTSDARSDVYALGVLLYELLTGEVPFRGATATLLHQVIHDDPPSPRKLNDRIPRDLETITLKCLEKDPAKRFYTSRQLADDLGRFLRSEPILARATGKAERTWRWCKRSPARAGLLTLLLLVSVVAPALGVREAWRYRQSLAQERELRIRLYGADMDAAMRLWLDGIVPEVERYLDRWRPQSGAEDLRGFEWYYLWRNCERSRATLTYDTHTSAHATLAYVPDADQVAMMFGDEWRLVDANTATLIRSVALPIRDNRWVMSSDGSLAAAFGKTDDGNPWLRLWQMLPEFKELMIGDSLTEVQQLKFSPDGSLLVTGDVNGLVRAWDTATGRLVHEVQVGGAGHELSMMGYLQTSLFAVSHDNSRLAVVTNHNDISLWSLADARPILALAGHGDECAALAFSHDDKLLATGGFDYSVKVWRVTDGVPIRTFVGHSDWATMVHWSPDDRLIASGSDDNTIRIWNVDSGNEVDTLIGHRDNISSLEFSPDRSSLASYCPYDGMLKFWRLDVGGDRPVLHGHHSVISAGALAPNERILATGDFLGEVRLWDLATGELSRPPLHDANSACLQMLYSPDSNWLFLALQDGQGLVWSTNDWTVQQRFHTGVDWKASPLAVTPDSKTLLVLTSDGLVRGWEIGAFREKFQLRLPAPTVKSIALSKDGATLASYHDGGSIELTEFPSGKSIGRLAAGLGEVVAIPFREDGRMLATICFDGRIQLWDIASRRQHGATIYHGPEAVEGAFLPGANRFISSSRDQSIRLWDTDSCHSQGVLLGTVGSAVLVIASTDGRLVISGGGDMKVRLWRAASPAEVAFAENE